MYKLVVLSCLTLARSSLGSVGHHGSWTAPAATWSAHSVNSYSSAQPIAWSGYAATAPVLAAGPALHRLAPASAIATTYAAAAPAHLLKTIATAPANANTYAAAPAPLLKTIATAPGIATSYAAAAPVIAAAPAPAIATYAAAPAIAVAPAARLATPAQIQTTNYAIQKNVHYASQPVVTGYSTSIVKPNLGGLATPLQTVSQQSVLAAGRQVQTITPHVTRVEPELHVQKVPVDVPVPTPVVSEVEVRTPVVHGAPVVAAPAVHAAAPAIAPAPAAVATSYAAAAPVVGASWAHKLAAPVSTSWAAAPAFHTRLAATSWAPPALHTRLYSGAAWAQPIAARLATPHLATAHLASPSAHAAWAEKAWAEKEAW